LSAQGVVRSGLYTKNGEIVYSDPQSSVAVSVVVKTVHFEPGEVARYAQKMLGVRASLAEKRQTEILSATICDKAPQSVVTEVKECEEVVLPVYKSDNRAQSIEQQATAAAEMIFSLRRSRKELITGDAGENVFGGGLKDALEALDAREQAYLELFLGKKITTTYTERIVLPLNGTTTAYTIAKLSPSAGLQIATAADGSTVKINLTPSGLTPKLATMSEVDSRDKTALQVRLADSTTCVVTVDDKVVGSAVLPVFEFGRTAYIANTAKR
jgi:hypothetical protein